MRRYESADFLARAGFGREVSFKVWRLLRDVWCCGEKATKYSLTRALPVVRR